LFCELYPAAIDQTIHRHLSCCDGCEPASWNANLIAKLVNGVHPARSC
jgi:hypothetical protein